MSGRYCRDVRWPDAPQRNEQPGKSLVHLVGAAGEALSYPADGNAWVTVDDPELLPWLAKVQVASVDGVPRIVGLQLLPRHEAPLPGGLQVRDFTVTAEALRRLPLRELRELALRMQRMEFGVPVRNVSPGAKWRFVGVLGTNGKDSTNEVRHRRTGPDGPEPGRLAVHQQVRRPGRGRPLLRVRQAAFAEAYGVTLG